MIRFSLKQTFSPLAVLALAACSTTPGAGDPKGVATGPVTPQKPLFVVSDVMERSADELDARLGAPALARIEGPGEFRRYVFKQCSLIVILYPNENGERRVSHAEAVAPTSEAKSPTLEDCLAAGLAPTKAGELVG